MSCPEQGQGCYGTPGIYKAPVRHVLQPACSAQGGLTFVQFWHQSSGFHRSLFPDRLASRAAGSQSRAADSPQGGRIMSKLRTRLAVTTSSRPGGDASVRIARRGSAPNCQMRSAPPRIATFFMNMTICNCGIMASRNSQIRVPSAGHFLSARSARLRS